MPRRLDDLIRFYDILARLDDAVGGSRLLSVCHGRMEWPHRGVYFFMEPGESRSDSGQGFRIVRVGTHALTAGSSTTLWKRLSQHKGQQASGGGNHRGSIFRLLVGSTLLDSVSCPSWGFNSSATRAIRAAEHSFERDVSAIIGAMPFLWLRIDDPPGPGSRRGYIERNSIALLSNLRKPELDARSAGWRGRYCIRGKSLVRDSGLWNQNHVDETYDSAFLDVFDGLVRTSK
jgi:hypothetical protein